MKGSVTAVLLGLWLALGALPAWAEEFPLSWQEVSRDDLVSGAIRAASRPTNPLPGKPALVTRLPEGIGDQLSYFSVILGGKAFILLIDNASPARLYADTDGDGDLAEETPFPLPPYPSKQPGEVQDPRVSYLGPIEFKLPGEAPEATIKAFARVFPADGPRMMILVPNPARYRSGKVRFGDRVCAVALVDTNANGAYNDTFSLPLKSPEILGDTFEIDLNGDGQFSMSLEPPLFEMLMLSRMVEVEGAYYSIEVPADGSKLRVERVEPKMGKLAVGGAEADLVLQSESGFHALKSTSAPWTLPVGKYLPLQILLKKADANGVVWSLPAFPEDLTKAKLPEVMEGQTTTLDLTPPTRAWVRVGRVDDSASFDLVLEGAEGLRYSPAVEKDGKGVPPPKFEVKNEAGKVVLADAFQYG